MPKIYEWKYMKSLEALIALRDKAKEKGWECKWTIYINDSLNRLQMEITDRSGNKHWFAADVDGNIVALPSTMTCY